MAYKLFTFKGIKISIHWSFLVLFGAIIAGYAFVEGTEMALVAGLFIIALFSSVMIHEFVHSFIAASFGFPANEITLYPLGGMSKIKEMPREPKQEFIMTIFGPISNLIIAGIAFSVGLILEGTSSELFGYTFDQYVFTFALMNLVLGLFNLVTPAFPMDGGRLLRSVLATQMPFPRATKIAVTVSRYVAFFLAIIGFFFNLFLILIAVFIYIAGTSEMEGTISRYLLEDVPVGDMMSKEVKTVSAYLTINDFLDKLLTEGHLGYLVEDNGQVVGMLTLENARSVPKEQRDEVVIGQVMRKDLYGVATSDPASKALQMMQENDIGRVLVYDPENSSNYEGIVTRSDLFRYVKIKNVVEGY